MSDKLLYINPAKNGNNLYAMLYQGDGTVFNVVTGKYEAFTLANYANYAIALSEQGGVGASGVFMAAMPSTVVTANHNLDIRVMSGSTAAGGDSQPTGYTVQQKFWDGNSFWTNRQFVTEIGLNSLISGL